MSWIQPNGSIWLLRGVDIDSGYNHTYYFPNLAAQTSFFSNIAATRGMKFEQQSYQRTNRGWLKVNCSYDEVCTYNYLMFNNQRFGGKWFYAFIDGAEYVNEHSTEISYTIDAMQTWYFDYKLGQCFVEREHTATDNLGEHILPEPVDGGTFTVKGYRRWEFSDPSTGNTPNKDFTIVILHIPKQTSETFPGYNGSIKNGLYYPYLATPITVDNTDIGSAITQITAYLDRLVNDNEAIVGMYACPAWFYKNILLEPQSFTTNFGQSDNFVYTGGDVGGGYIPKNKKLYTSQYNYLTISDNANVENKYGWEMFKQLTSSPTFIARFEVIGATLPTPEILLYPLQYRGVIKDYESGIPFTNFPQLSWSEDSFARWWAQNKESFLLKSIGGAVGMVAGAATGQVWLAAGGASLLASSVNDVNANRNRGVTTEALNPPNRYVSNLYRGNINNITANQNAIAMRLKANETTAMVGGTVGALTAITSTLATLAGAANLTNKIYGANTGGSLIQITDSYGYTFLDVGVCGEEAKVIDKYFDMFGYQVNEVKIPNIRGGGNIRPSWNYVKTGQCIIHSANGTGLPQEDENIIENVYNKGITFWNTNVQVGDYSANNLPT